MYAERILMTTTNLILLVIILAQTLTLIAAYGNNDSLEKQLANTERTCEVTQDNVIHVFDCTLNKGVMEVKL